MSFTDILKQYKHISLDDMDKVKLQNRVDTKYVFKRSQLEQLLMLLKDEYDVVEIKNEIAPNYKSLYFDTDDFQNYRQHLIGKSERHKVRIRNYVSSNLFFLELKKKHKGRTVKTRMPINKFENNLSSNSMSYIETKLDSKSSKLKPVLEINYKRITLANKARSERVTLDVDLSFSHDSNLKNLNQIVIAEHKQPKVNHDSVFYKCVKRLQIRNVRISKYCTGMILTYPFLKYNRFKEKLLYVNKLTNGYIERNIAA